jgi:hypothetical protein
MADEKLSEQREDALLRRLLRLAGNPATVSDQVALRVKENVHGHWKQQLRTDSRKRMLWIFTGTIAACFVFAVALWFSLASIRTQREPVAVVQTFVGRASMQEPGSTISNLISRKTIVFTNSILETDPEARALLRILGGITLRMDASTRIQFKSDSVLVLERGVVNLDTGKTHRRLTVSTAMGNVIDNGTRFQVRLNDNRIEISVREGSVSLNQNGGQTHAITAGNRLIASANGEILVNKFDIDESEAEGLNKMSGNFNLEGRTLMEFLLWISKQNGWTLKFSDPKIEKNAGPVVLHGSVAALLPQQMLAAVLPVCGLNYKLKDGVLTISESD